MLQNALGHTFELSDIIDFLAQCFSDVYHIGDQIQLDFGHGTMSITLNQFLIGLFVLGLILSTILVFGKSAFSASAGRVMTASKNIKSKKRSEE